MFQTAALRPAYQTPLSIHKHLVPDDVRLMSIPPLPDSPAVQADGLPEALDAST